MRAEHKGGQFKQSPCYIAQDRPELGLFCSKGQMGAHAQHAGRAARGLRGRSQGAFPFGITGRIPTRNLGEISLVKGVP